MPNGYSYPQRDVTNAITVIFFPEKITACNPRTGLALLKENPDILSRISMPLQSIDWTRREKVTFLDFI
jgi:hypothetical protein